MLFALLVARIARMPSVPPPPSFSPSLDSSQRTVRRAGLPQVATKKCSQIPYMKWGTNFFETKPFDACQFPQANMRIIA